MRVSSNHPILFVIESSLQHLLAQDKTNLPNDRPPKLEFPAFVWLRHARHFHGSTRTRLPPLIYALIQSVLPPLVQHFHAGRAFLHSRQSGQPSVAMQYTGQIQDGQMHGFGTLVYPNKERYEVRTGRAWSGMLWRCSGGLLTSQHRLRCTLRNACVCHNAFVCLCVGGGRHT